MLVALAFGPGAIRSVRRVRLTTANADVVTSQAIG